MVESDKYKRIYKNLRRSDHTFTPPLKIAFVYLIPPSMFLIGSDGYLPPSIMSIAAFGVILNTIAGGIWLKGFHSENFQVNQFDPETPLNKLENDVWSQSEQHQPSTESARLEYEQIAEEVRTYNTLAVRSTYFSLATLAILTSVFFAQMGTVFQPFVAGFGIAISFAFTVTVEKNVLLRDLFRSRQLHLENTPSFEGTLTAAQTWNLGLDYGKFPSAGLGLQLVDFNKLWMYVWIISYHVSVLYTAFFVIQ